MRFDFEDKLWKHESVPSEDSASPRRDARGTACGFELSVSYRNDYKTNQVRNSCGMFFFLCVLSVFDAPFTEIN